MVFLKLEFVELHFVAVFTLQKQLVRRVVPDDKQHHERHVAVDG